MERDDDDAWGRVASPLKNAFVVELMFVVGWVEGKHPEEEVQVHQGLASPSVTCPLLMALFSEPVVVRGEVVLVE